MIDTEQRLTRAGMPALGLGTWKLRGSTCADRVADGLAMGYRHVDTADMYGNHERVGEGLRRAPVDRGDVFLTTKIWLEDLDRSSVERRTEQALRDLGTDHVDLLLIHWPNPDVPLRETLEAMLVMKDRGWTRHLGLSNFTPSLVERARQFADPICNQVEYHPRLAQDRLLDTLRAHGMALVAYSPLARGSVQDEPVLRSIGGEHGKSPAQVALRWLLQQENVGAVPKASSREHLAENLDVFDFELSDEEMRMIDALTTAGDRQIDPEFAPAWERPDS